MSIDLNIYIGWYVECPKAKVNTLDMEDEKFFLVWDEGGARDVNKNDIYVPNIPVDGCYHLGDDERGGILPLNKEPWPPNNLLDAIQRMRDYYGAENVVFKYGIVKFWR
jgi:hypothetical protein